MRKLDWLINIYRQLQHLLIDLEYLLIGLYEKLFGKSSMNSDLAANCTILVKTYERPRTVKRLIESIHRHYPGIQVVLVDDSADPIDPGGVTFIRAPYQSGLSYGRNLGLKAINTPYFLLLDDDMYLTSRTNLEDAFSFIKEHPNIDIMGGEVTDLPFFLTRNFFGLLNIDPDHRLRLEIGISKGSIGSVNVYDVVSNFFLARTDSIKKILWDDFLFVFEHEDFFLRAKEKLTITYNPSLKVLHRTSEINKSYLKRRYDINDLRSYLEKKHGIKWIY